MIISWSHYHQRCQDANEAAPMWADEASFYHVLAGFSELPQTERTLIYFGSIWIFYPAPNSLSNVPLNYLEIIEFYYGGWIQYRIDSVCID